MKFQRSSIKWSFRSSQILSAKRLEVLRLSVFIDRRAQRGKYAQGIGNP